MMIYKLLATVGVFLVLLCGIQTRPLKTPDFVSDWMELDSTTPAKSRIKVYHGLGEVPIMVVVKGRAPSGANEDYVFHGIGIRPRDDDSKDPYAAITYVYNDLKVIVGAMSKSNNYAGFATYTANNTYWKGPSTGSTTTAVVQIMAWKASSLPDPDFHVPGIKVRAGCTNGTTCFIERNHGMHEYPSLVVVRTKLEDDTKPLNQYYSDAVGAGLMTYIDTNIPTTYRKNGYVVYGFDKNNIRIWMDSQPKAVLFQGSDGSKFGSDIKTGSIEILVWRTSSLRPTTTKYLQLASLPGEEFDQETSIPVTSDSNKNIVFLWAKATDGVNEGFCFPRSGSMSYFTPADTVCSGRCNYGGLTYAYTNSTLRIWKPENTPLGNIIAIPIYFAGGHKVQKSNQALAVAEIWVLKDTTLNQACYVDHDCIDANSICSNTICLCKDGFYEVGKQCEKDLQCEDSVPILPDLEIRGRNNKVDESNTEDYIVDDSRLKHSWYSTTTVKGQFLMPDLGTRLEPNTCGALSQVIVNGTHINQTTLTSMPYTLGVCYVNCSVGLDILLRQCDNGEIQYNLPSLEIPKTAYCFDSPELQGVDEFEDPPEISFFGQFEVNVHLEFETKPVTAQPEFNNYFPYLKFSCDNDTVFEEGLFFTTYWYIGNKLITALGPSLSTEPLLESMLLERNIGLGFHMKCGIRVSRSHTGILSDLHTSSEKFYGIKVHTPNIVLDKGSNAIVKLQPTLPIGCMYSSFPLPGDLGCVQTLQMTYPKTDSCQSNNILSVSSTSGCGPRFKALKLNDKWDKDEVYEFNITTKDRNFADGHQFRLSMTMERKNHIIWRNDQIEDILIYVTHNSAYKYKLCYSHVDPHMQTGDLHKYEHQYEGFFIFYRNFKFGIEVQMRTIRCNNGRATCACAVAVRVGGDVFLINLCGGLKYIDFTSCSDGGILDVRKRSSLKYQVFTPIGTYIDLTIRPHRNYFNLMNVDIYMAPKDLHQTEGLCGYFDNDATNDLKGRGTNGVTYTTTNKPRNFHPEFSEEWRLTKNDKNYLVLDPGYVPIWQEEGLDMFCFCDADLQTATCSASLYKDCPVSRYSVTRKLCDKHLSRKKRNPMAFHRERERRQVLVDRDVQHNEIYVFSILIPDVKAVLPDLGVNHFRDELVTYYFRLGYTWKEICGFLYFTHNIVVTLRQIRRIVERLGLRRYRVGSPLPDVINEVRKLCKRGLSNAGYRTIWKILKSSGRVNASQETVRHILKAMDPAGVILRSRRRLRRRIYINRGPNFIMHLDGYDKLKPFGISIHGAIDGYSRKILWLRAAYTNKDPKIVARYYVEYIKSIRKVPRVVRADCGTENCVIRDLQMALRYYHGDSMSGRKSFLYGRSTSNQRIERFWGVLNGNFTTFWKNYFKDLRDSGYLHDHDPVHIECVRFCFLSLMQRDLDEIADMWNRHRIRHQTQNENPTGVSPDVMYYQSQLYSGVDCGYPLPCELNEIDIISQRYTSTCPRLGCKDTFVQALEELTGMDRDELEQPSTLELATLLFINLTEYLDGL